MDTPVYAESVSRDDSAESSDAPDGQSDCKSDLSTAAGDCIWVEQESGECVIRTSSKPSKLMPMKLVRSAEGELCVMGED